MNPRAAINDLHPFQGCPFGQLGYFSVMPEIIRWYEVVLQITEVFLITQTGEGGIRTHAPFRTNGFQDRLVMTASIPLHNRIMK